MISNLKATKGCTDLSGSLKAEGHSNEESNKVTYVQEPKPEKTIPTMGKNYDVKVLSDLSASTRKRRRSSHISLPPAQTGCVNTHQYCAGGQGKRKVDRPIFPNTSYLIVLEENGAEWDHLGKK